MRPLTSTTPKSPELNRLIMLPLSCNTNSKDQLLRQCPELSHLASPDSGFDKCVCVHARSCVYRVARLKAVGGALGIQGGWIWFCQADAQRVWVPVVTQIFLHSNKHTTVLTYVHSEKAI